MAKKGAYKEERLTVSYFDGLNAAVQTNLSKKTELAHMENARAPVIGVLEKRQGQAKTGTSTLGDVFYTTANYGLRSFKINSNTYKGLIRISDHQTYSNTKTISVFEDVTVSDHIIISGHYNPTTVFVNVFDRVTVSEPTFFTRMDDRAVILDGTSSPATIYSLNSSDQWAALSDTSAQNIIGADFDFAKVNGAMVLVNGKDYNRLLAEDGTTVTDSTEAGSLFNSPRAKKAAFYKNRIYLANFTRNGVKYPTTILRSSYPLGIVALVNGDVTASTTVTVTDTKYFYSDSGMNSYEVYRGGTLVTTLTVTAVNETSVTVSGATTLLSSDEIWIAGTFRGEKQYRWINNPTAIGRDVKQYDTFKLSGGDEDEITLMETIGNVLMIGNSNNLMSWNDYTLQNYDLGIGCASRNGYVKLLGTLYFLHYSGVYSTSGDIPLLVSRKIEKYIKGATKSGIENAAVGFKGLSVFFSIGDVRLYKDDGSYWKTLGDVCLEYGVADKNWYVHTNVPAEEFTNFISTDGTERLYMAHGGTGKSIKEFLVGNTDDGDEIFFRADTHQLQFLSEFELFVNPTTIITRLDRGTLMKTMVSLDGGQFYEVPGSNLKGVSSLKINAPTTFGNSPPICRRIGISFRDSSTQLCRISQFAISYLPQTLDEAE